MAAQSNGDAGLVRPLADASQEGKGQVNLEQAISLLKAEREAYIELQHQAFTDTAGLWKAKNSSVERLQREFSSRTVRGRFQSYKHNT